MDRIIADAGAEVDPFGLCLSESDRAEYEAHLDALDASLTAEAMADREREVLERQGGADEGEAGYDGIPW